MQFSSIANGVIVCWFSAGAASACATKLALEQFQNVVVYRIWMPDEHADNDRFSDDVQRWIHKEIICISSLFPSVEAVIQKRKFIAGPQGAPCTTVMKKHVRFYVERFHEQPIVGHVFGFTVEERKRYERIREDMLETEVYAPLIDANMTAEDCKRMIIDAGIQLPYLYRLGFPHNNCIGCVKSGSKAYWSLVRDHFPDVFAQRSRLEQQYNRSFVRRGNEKIWLTSLRNEQNEQAANDEEVDEGGCSFVCSRET